MMYYLLELTLLCYYQKASLELCLPAVPRSGVILLLMSCIFKKRLYEGGGVQYIMKTYP